MVRTFSNKIVLVLFLIIISGTQLPAQNKRANIWYFGNKAGIDFNYSVPVALTDGEMSTSEGCASIADANGNLLFYTDGRSVWNKNHLIMPNGTGLMGHSSSTQSGVIVPQPGNDSIYYVFTITAVAGFDGFRYSRVNMNLADGLGNVEISTKNTLILTPVTEKIIATRHINGKDIWVITHGWGNNNFYAYLVTDTGFVSTPIISSSGIEHKGSSINALGQLKVSNDGSKLVLCIQSLSKTQLFDFNITTGIVSNPVTFPIHSNNYGCEFSPDKSKLYISCRSTVFIYQYDISSNDSATIVNTGILITPMSNARFGSIQMAPDGKMYVANSTHTYLSCIEKPNEKGLACEFKLNGVDLSGRRSNLGLPNFIGNYISESSFNSSNFCSNDETIFEFTGVSIFDSLEWHFGDGSSLNVNNEKIISHKYEDIGTYNVKLIRWYQGRKDSTFNTITIYPQKHILLPIFICEGDSVYLQGEFRKESGLYSDTFFNGSTRGCDSIVESSLTVFPKVTEWVDITICSSDSAYLGGEFQREEGVYYDTFFNASSKGCDSVIVTNLFFAVPEVNVQSFNECEGFSVTVGSNTYTQTGVYKDVINVCDTFITQLNIYDTPYFYFIQNDDTCIDNLGKIEGRILSGNPPYSYSWNNGATDSVIYGLSSGIYYLIVVDSNGCVSSDTTEVLNINIGCDLVFYVPTAFSPNGDGSNDVFRVLGQHISKINVQILSRWGEEIFKSTDIDFAWDGTYRGQPCQDGVYTVIIYYETHLEQGKTYLFRGTLHLMR